MKIATILDHIDTGHMALPEFQRGYVWNRDQVRGLMQSLYQRHPVGSLLVWATQSDGADYRGEGDLAPGVVKLLLDGQQRITSLYGIVRGAPPKFFDGNAQAFTGLHFHLETEEFAFYSPVKMRDDVRWIDVSSLMRDGLAKHITVINGDESLRDHLGEYMERLNRIGSIKEIELHTEEVTGPDKTIDVVVDIFNRVNSGGTKLSKGDLALAKICAEAPDARDRMKSALVRWRDDGGYHFTLDWLLRNVNTVATGEAKFHALHAIDAKSFASGLARAEKAIDYMLNIIDGRLGLDHDRVFFARYAMPIMTHFVDRHGGSIPSPADRDRLLFWYIHAALWGRFSGSTESFLDKDLEALEELDQGIDRLIEQLKLWRGSLAILPDHFGGWSRGDRFYPMLYLLTRIGEAKDWGTGIPLKGGMLGKMSALEMHHIFPKAQLYKAGYKKSQVNAVANFCFQTKATNLAILDRAPEDYFPEIEDKYPGALASQWIPTDPHLWKMENYLDFLQARRELLAGTANAFLDELFHGDTSDLKTAASDTAAATLFATGPTEDAIGGVDSEEEERELMALNDWVVEQGLPEGQYLYELSDPETGKPIAIFDLAWPDGLQVGLSEPVAVLLDEGPKLLAIANEHKFRYFTDRQGFEEYVERDVLAREAG